MTSPRTNKREAAEAALAHAALIEHLADLVDNDAHVPCVDADEWTSDDLDDQREAAAACQGCAGLTPCRAYIEQHVEDAGVWAGLLPPTSKSPRRPLAGEATQ